MAYGFFDVVAGITNAQQRNDFKKNNVVERISKIQFCVAGTEFCFCINQLFCFRIY